MKTEFVCVDVETTGLDVEKDRIIEVAAVRFTMETTLDAFESLVKPGCPIPRESQEIHHINDEMVASAPTIEQILPQVIDFIADRPIVGHGINFDVRLLARDAGAAGITHYLDRLYQIDTLRLARIYGQSATNSLDALRAHFNIEWQGAHRALSDVHVNIEVFRKLAQPYKSFKALQEALARPVLMKLMPLGKYKGRPLKEVPVDYLRWAINKLTLDRDLKFSIDQELSRRKKGRGFDSATSPFGNL